MQQDGLEFIVGQLALIIVFIVLMVIAGSSIIVVNESTRYYVFRFGKNFRLAGPRIVQLLPLVVQFVKWELGASGEMTSATTAKFNGKIGPVGGGSSLGVGTRVLIASFGPAEILVRKI